MDILPTALPWANLPVHLRRVEYGGNYCVDYTILRQKVTLLEELPSASCMRRGNLFRSTRQEWIWLSAYAARYVFGNF
jgi:hypothetical protein